VPVPSRAQDKLKWRRSALRGAGARLHPSEYRTRRSCSRVMWTCAAARLLRLFLAATTGTFRSRSLVAGAPCGATPAHRSQQARSVLGVTLTPNGRSRGALLEGNGQSPRKTVRARLVVAAARRALSNGTIAGEPGRSARTARPSRGGASTDWLLSSRTRSVSANMIRPLALGLALDWANVTGTRRGLPPQCGASISTTATARELRPSGTTPLSPYLAEAMWSAALAPSEFRAG
jgi:hypothetical protein